MSHTNTTTLDVDAGEKTYSLTATLEDFRYLNAMFSHYKKHACKFCYLPIDDEKYSHEHCGATA